MDDATFVRIAKALADPTRAAIVRALRESGPLNCSQVCAMFPQSQPTISHHLRTLHDAGVLGARKQGVFHVLSLREATLRSFARSLGAGARSKAAGTPRPAKARPGAAPAKKTRARSA